MFMKPWLRLLLVLLTVGGGFAGATFTSVAFFRAQGASAFLSFVGFVLYLFITTSGLLFVHDAKHTAPLAISLGLQVPWLSNALFTYVLKAGCALTIGLVGDSANLSLKFETLWLGSEIEMTMHPEPPWVLGVNLVPLVLLLLLWQARKAAKPPQGTSQAEKQNGEPLPTRAS
jgi:hypothetical protein